MAVSEEATRRRRPISRDVTGTVAKGAATSYRLRQHSSPPERARGNTTSLQQKEAFGSTVKRFRTSRTAVPGPGRYFKAPTPVWDTTSLSQAGYGSMVSCSERFSSRVVYSGPGPGEYRQPEGGSMQHKPQTAAAKQCGPPWASLRRAESAPGKPASAAAPPPPNHSAAAGQPLNDDPHGTAGTGCSSHSAAGGGGRPDTPGPGSYEHMAAHYLGKAVVWNQQRRGAFRSAFKAQGRNVPVPGSTLTPPPGRYQRLRRWGTHEGKHTMFKNNQGHDRPQPPAGPLDLIFNAKGAGIGSGTPGPGHYNMQDAKGLAEKLSHLPGAFSSMFATAGVDRFGTPKWSSPRFSSIPGPGQYDSHRVHAFASDVRGAAALPFRSVVPRCADDPACRSEVPGPGFYTGDRMPKKQSFHLNAHKRYVTML